MSTTFVAVLVMVVSGVSLTSTPASTTPASTTPASTPPASTPAPTFAPTPAPPAVSAPRPSPPPSAETLLREAVAIEPTGALIRLGQEPEAVVDPAATFRVELASTVRDARLLLLDGADALVPAAATREIGATTRLTLSPAEPLRPGSRYRLRVDGAATRNLHDAAGGAFAPVSLVVLAAGEPPKPEQRAKPKHAKRRRGQR